MSSWSVLEYSKYRGRWSKLKGLSMKFESLQNFDSTDFGDELLLTTTTEKSL